MRKQVRVINEYPVNDCLKVLLEEKRRREKIKYVWEADDGMLVPITKMTDNFLDECILKTKTKTFL